MTSVSLGVGPFMKSPPLGSRLGGRGTVPQGSVKSHDMRPESPGRGVARRPGTWAGPWVIPCSPSVRHYRWKNPIARGLFWRWFTQTTLLRIPHLSQ